MKKIQLGGHRFKKCPIQGYAFVSDIDFTRVNKYKWYLNKNTDGKGYACTRIFYKKIGKTKLIRMHRFIIGDTKDLVIDHINRNPIDNRRKNLRVCTQSKNILNSKIHKNNTTGHKNITIDKRTTKRYSVNVRHDMKSVWIGRFHTLKEAVQAKENFYLNQR